MATYRDNHSPVSSDNLMAAFAVISFENWFDALMDKID